MDFNAESARDFFQRQQPRIALDSKLVKLKQLLADAADFRRLLLGPAALGSERLAAKGVYIGTSSWKYPGWRGMIYDESRHITRGKISKSRFERNCLAGYAETFKTVCVDAGYYQFPDRRYIEKLVSQVPSNFLFTFKVTDEITVAIFANCIGFEQPSVSPILFMAVFGGWP